MEIEARDDVARNGVACGNVLGVTWVDMSSCPSRERRNAGIDGVDSICEFPSAGACPAQPSSLT